MYSSSSNFQTSAQTVFNSTAQQGRGSSAASSKGINSVLRGQGISTVVTPTATAFLSLSGSSSTFSPSIIDNIEQTFIDFQSVPVSQSSAPGAHMQSGFVPPVIDPIPQEQTFPRDLSVPRTPTSEFSPTSKASSHPSTTPNMVTTGTVAPPAHMQGGIHEQMNNWHQSGGPNSNSSSVKQGPRRHTGPRPPKNESNISPEEAERRRVRRERNKLAAAKCRKRRMDHTSQLQEEVEELESIQQEIHGEIMSLQKQKEQLEFILEAHKVQCKRGIPIHTLPAVYVPPLTVHNDADVKPDFSSNLSNDSMSSATSSSSPAPPMQARSMLSSTTPSSAPASAPPSAPAIQRPTSLPIIVKQEPQDGTHPESMDINVTQATGISISTPRVSPRVLSLFDTIGDHTGLTPITGSGIGSNGTPISGGSMTTPFAANASQMRLGGPSDASTPASHDRSAEKPNSHTLMSL